MSDFSSVIVRKKDNKCGNCSSSSCSSSSNCSSSSCSSSTINALEEVKCVENNILRVYPDDTPSNALNPRVSSTPTRRYEEGNDSFNAVITPVTNLSATSQGTVEFRMRRKNRTVTLQWEPFTAQLATNGIAYLSVNQSLSNLPPYLLSFPFYFKYKDVPRLTHIEVDPQSKSINIRIYLNSDGSSTNTNIGDAIAIPGTALTWIVDS